MSEALRAKVARFVLCPSCEGRGSSSAYLGAFTMDEFHEDPDFAESYLAGDYDRPCTDCSGQRVVAGCAHPECPLPRELITFPFWTDRVAEHCYDHFTSDERDTYEHSRQSWSEYNSGC